LPEHATPPLTQSGDFPGFRPGEAVVAGASSWLWRATLLTLPWVGADLISLVSGRDAGAGLQPAWLLMAALWLCSWRRTDWRCVPRRWRWWFAGAAVAVGVSGLGLVVVPADIGPGAAWARFAKQGIQLAIMAAFAAWPLLHVRGSSAWRLTARWLVAGALLQVAYGLLQEVSFFRPLPLLAALEKVFTSNPSILSGSGQLYVGDRFLAVPRLRGTACEPLYLGNYLLLALPLVFVTGWRRLGRAAAVVALLALLLLTWSRGAWLGAVGGVLATVWLAWPQMGQRTLALARRRDVLAVTALVAVAVVVAAMAGWEPVLLPLRRLAQTFSTQDWSNLTRLYSLQAAWRAFCLSPVCGIGWGQFGWHFPALVDPAGLQAMFTWPVVANFPMLVLCETGLIGFGVMMVAGTGLCRDVARRRARGATAVLVAIGAACAAIAIQSMTFSQYNLAHAWVAVGLLGASVLEASTGASSGRED
jgi:hypothetical protein